MHDGKSTLFTREPNFLVIFPGKKTEAPLSVEHDRKDLWFSTDMYKLQLIAARLPLCLQEASHLS